jgi:hypothetical protein
MFLKGNCIEEFWAQYMTMKKENWRILTNKEIYASVKKTYSNRDNKVK